MIIKLNTAQVYEANPVIILANGTELIKMNNRGVTSLFPNSWDRNKILDEVEYAIEHNHGRDFLGARNEYFGFSSQLLGSAE